MTTISGGKFTKFSVYRVAAVEVSEIKKEVKPGVHPRFFAFGG